MDFQKIISLVTTYAVPALIALVILFIGFRLARAIALKAENVHAHPLQAL